MSVSYRGPRLIFFVAGKLHLSLGALHFVILIFPSEIGSGILNFGSLNGVGDRFVSGYYENFSKQLVTGVIDIIFLNFLNAWIYDTG